MERKLTVELNELKAQILAMGELAKHALREAIRAWLNRDGQAAQSVLDGEVAINQQQIETDLHVVQMLARYQLMATDLRFALAVGRISNDLERIGDQAVNIAQAAQRILGQALVKSEIDISGMSDLAETMVRDSLDAFVRDDLDVARSVLKRDDQMDQARDHLLQKFVAHMVSDPPEIVPIFNHVLVVKSFERVGDHATNIAEDVIYYIAGDDVRHRTHGQQPNSAKS